MDFFPLRASFLFTPWVFFRKLMCPVCTLDWVLMNLLYRKQKEKQTQKNKKDVFPRLSSVWTSQCDMSA